MRKIIIILALIAITFLFAGKLGEFAEDQADYGIQQQSNAPAPVVKPKSKLDLFEESIQILPCDSLFGTQKHLKNIIDNLEKIKNKVEKAKSKSKKMKKKKRKKKKLIGKKISFYEEALEIVNDILDEECDEDEET